MSNDIKNGIVKLGLGTSIAWFARNIIGGEAYFSYVNGLKNPGNVINGFALLKKSTKATKGKTALNPEEVSLLKLAIQDRIIGSGFFSREGMNVAGTGVISKTIDKISSPLFRLNQYFEDSFKLGNWIDLQKRGYPINVASNQIRKIFGDPARAATPGMKATSSVITFTNWLTHSMGSTIWALGHVPQKIQRIGQAQYESEKAFGFDRETASYPIRRQTPLIYGKSKTEEGLEAYDYIPLTSLIPTPDIGMIMGPLKQTVREIASATVPHAKLIMELASDINLYTGYPLKRGKRAEYSLLPALPTGEKLPKMLKRGLDIAGSRGVKQAVTTVFMPVGRVEVPMTEVQKGRKTYKQALSGYILGLKGKKYVPFKDMNYSLINLGRTVEDLYKLIPREFMGGYDEESTRRTNAYNTIDKLQDQFAEFFKLIPERPEKRNKKYQEKWLELEKLKRKFVVKKERKYLFSLTELMGDELKDIQDDINKSLIELEAQFKAGRGGKW